jgi:hypothetical protein
MLFGCCASPYSWEETWEAFYEDWHPEDSLPVSKTPRFDLVEPHSPEESRSQDVPHNRETHKVTEARDPKSPLLTNLTTPPWDMLRTSPIIEEEEVDEDEDEDAEWTETGDD